MGLAAAGLFLGSGAPCGFCRRDLGEHIHTCALPTLLPFGSALGVAPGPVTRFQCSQCPASFTLKSNMDRHEKTVHFNCKKMRCPNCAKLFRDKTDLKRHLTSVHSNEPAFVCLFCGKGFGTQRNLANHGKVCYLGGLSFGMAQDKTTIPRTRQCTRHFFETRKSKLFHCSHAANKRTTGVM